MKSTELIAIYNTIIFHPRDEVNKIQRKKTFRRYSSGLRFIDSIDVDTMTGTKTMT